MSRAPAVKLTLVTPRFFWNSPHGPEPDATSYHNSYFRDSALLFGLTCAWHGNIGYRETRLPKAQDLKAPQMGSLAKPWVVGFRFVRLIFMPSLHFFRGRFKS
jgi:hypothetical protein